jgi:hypothetical protein
MQGVLVFRMSSTAWKDFRLGMGPTRRAHDLWTADLIVGRVAITLEDAFEVA